MAKMKVSLVISNLSLQRGGMSASVQGLARAIARAGASVRLFTVGRNGGIRGFGGLSVAEARPSWPRAMARSCHLSALLATVGDGAVLHGHGLWQFPVHHAAEVCRQKTYPFLVSPHGMLEPWALKRARWKKRLAGWLFQDRDLHCADCLHALGPSEVQSFREYGLKNPVAVVPNGIDIEDFADLHRHERTLQDRFPALRDRPVVLFLARIHPKKGLLHLVDAWAKVHKDHSDWLLVIVGPDAGGHRAEVEQKVRSPAIEGSVFFPGPLYGEDKIAALAAGDVFVLPSFSEGFSMAVLEAMASRLPVLITPGCNFPDVEQEGAGIIVEPNATSVEHGLRQFLELSEGERREMGLRGRRMIEERYTWDKVAAQMIEVYEWLLGTGGMPDCVAC